MANSITYSSVSSKSTTNTGYNAVLVSPVSGYNIWYLKVDLYTDQVGTVTLDGVDYDIRFRWNTRDQSWQVIFSPSGGDPVATFKATNGIDLLRPYKYKEDIPDGELYIIDTVKINGRPSFGSTGVTERFTFAYVDSKQNQS